VVREQQRHRILVLDEHDLSRAVLRALLVRDGYECCEVETFTAALTAIETFDPHIVIYEPHLRAACCVGIARSFRSRARARGRSLVLIAISALDEPEDFRSREDVDAYLTKPFRAEELHEVLVPSVTPAQNSVTRIT